jgi:hypothetical protein
MRRGRTWLVLILVSAAVAGVVLIRRDDDKGRAAAELASQYNYCVLATRFDGVATAAGLKLRPAPETDPAADAVRLVMSEMGPDVDEMPKLAPDEVRGDVKTVVQSLHDADQGDLTGVKSAKFTEARQRMTDFAEGVCAPQGSGSGDG